MRWCSFILCRPIWKYHTALARLPQTSLLCGTLLHMERSGHEKKSERGANCLLFKVPLSCPVGLCAGVRKRGLWAGEIEKKKGEEQFEKKKAAQGLRQRR